MSQTFDSFLKNPILLKNLTQKMGFTDATPIQVATAPIIMSGKNLFAGAKTGSGKTVAFLAPLSERMFDKQIKRILVLAPTRELVIQMDEEAMNILDGQTDVVSVPLYGGVPTDPQILAIKHHKPRVFIGTPGRIIDLIQEGVLPLGEIEAVVLDEADRMCDMGFAPQVRQILDMIPNIRQMLCFTATLPEELGEIMKLFCPDAERIQVDAADESSTTIHHEAVFTSRRSKVRDLEKIVAAPGAISIIFVRTRNRADEIYRDLSRRVQSIGILHAGFSMNERERTIRDFRDGKIKTLIATDVVARGIDVDIVTHVVHFDLPDALDDYIHRSGRSGRAGRVGHTIALIESDSRNDMDRFKLFQKKIDFQIQGGEIPPDSIAEQASREEYRGRGPQRGSRSGGANRNSRGPSRGRPPQEDRSKQTSPSDGPRTQTTRSHSGRSRGPGTHAPRPPRDSSRTSDHRGPQKLDAFTKQKVAAKKDAGIIAKTKGFFKNMFSKS